ncbi:MAG: GNAT family N-acetyltransferase [Chitinispirillaceae bacterium]
MHTYFIGKEEVSQYAKDFANRLNKLNDSFPCIWCTIGKSGDELADFLYDYFPLEYRQRILVIPLQCDRDSKSIVFDNPADKNILNSKCNVLILDGAIHSGSSMLSATKMLRELGVEKITSYSLVLKAGSSFIPNFFGLIIADHDRAFFLLDEIPNNRIMPFGTIRKLTSDDATEKIKFQCGLESIDRFTWADFWYECVAGSNQVYVYENGPEISGFISFTLNDKTLFIDSVASDKKCVGQKIGQNLMRWAESWARSNNCIGINLWAIDERIGFYTNLGFETCQGKEMQLGKEKYTSMFRKLLYNIDPCCIHN